MDVHDFTLENEEFSSVEDEEAVVSRWFIDDVCSVAGSRFTGCIPAG